jgi:hypothetical protein
MVVSALRLISAIGQQAAAGHCFVQIAAMPAPVFGPCGLWISGCVLGWVVDLNYSKIKHCYQNMLYSYL